MESNSENVSHELHESLVTNNNAELITEPPVEVLEKSGITEALTDFKSSILQALEDSKSSILQGLEDSKSSILQEVLEDDAVFEYTNDSVRDERVLEDPDGEHYKYTNIDQLDEDDIIPGQIYVLMSFISPERIMNCDIRGVKIRGVYASREKAEKALEVLKKKDKYFDIWLGEVGKWLPWNPNTGQADEVIYRNKKLDKIMGKVHKTEVETLNELVGRRKEQLNKDKGAHKDRIKNSIKDAVRNYDGNENGGDESTIEPKSTKIDNSKSKEVNGNNSKSRQNNAEAIKQRLRKTLEKRAESKVVADNKDTQQSSQKVEELKMTSDEIQGKLEKMKEFMKNRNK